MLKQPWAQLVGWELTYNKGFADVIGCTINPRDEKKRICVAEVKRTRSDLLQDIKKKKLLKYEHGSTHCYLAGTREALNSEKLGVNVLSDLDKLGLPKHWGILELTDEVKCLRPARQINKLNLNRLSALIRRLARSHMYRCLNGLGYEVPGAGESISDSEEQD